MSALSCNDIWMCLHSHLVAVCHSPKFRTAFNEALNGQTVSLAGSKKGSWMQRWPDKSIIRKDTKFCWMTWCWRPQTVLCCRGNRQFLIWGFALGLETPWIELAECKHWQTPAESHLNIWLYLQCPRVLSGILVATDCSVKCRTVGDAMDSSFHHEPC